MVRNEGKIKTQIQGRNRDKRLNVHFGGGQWLWGSGQPNPEFSYSVSALGRLGEGSWGEHLQGRGWGLSSSSEPGFLQSVSVYLLLRLGWGLWSPEFQILFLLNYLCFLEISQIRHLLLIPFPIFSEIGLFHNFYTYVDHFNEVQGGDQGKHMNFSPS